MTKINWYNGKTANSASDMQKLCDAVNRSLLTPESAPADTKVVAVDTANTQKMLTIGDGLSIENDTLKASGGSGKKLYNHQLKASNLIYLQLTHLVLIYKKIMETEQITGDYK